MSFFRRERREKERYRPMATVVFTVRSGKDPGKVSSPVTGDVQDVSSTGMSVITTRLAPDGLHIMYDTLMIFRNRIDAPILLEGKPCPGAGDRGLVPRRGRTGGLLHLRHAIRPGVAGPRGAPARLPEGPRISLSVDCPVLRRPGVSSILFYSAPSDGARVAEWQTRRI